MHAVKWIKGFYLFCTFCVEYAAKQLKTNRVNFFEDFSIEEKNLCGRIHNMYSICKVTLNLLCVASNLKISFSCVSSVKHL